MAIYKVFFENYAKGYRCLKSIVIERRHHQLGRMADFPSPVTFSVFYLENPEVPQIKSQTMWHPLMNLVNTTLSQKYGDP